MPSISPWSVSEGVNKFSIAEEYCLQMSNVFTLALSVQIRRYINITSINFVNICFYMCWREQFSGMLIRRERRWWFLSY